MFIEMTCKCDASFQVETTDNETLAMVWAQSFINTHEGCGYIIRPAFEDNSEKTKRIDIMYKEEREKEL
jgi:hypothetical protein